MLGHQFAHSSAPIRKVKEVQFGILSPEEIVSTFTPFRFRSNFPGTSLESLLRRQGRTSRSYG